MQTISARQFRLFNDALADIYAAERAEDLVTCILTHVPALIPMDSCAFFPIGDDQFQYLDVVSPNIDPALFPQYKDYYEQFDDYKRAVFSRTPIPTIDRSSDYMDYDAWAMNPHRADFLLPNGMYHLAGVQIVVHGALLADLSFHRDVGPDFSDREMLLLQQMQRHLGQAFAACALREEARARQQTPLEAAGARHDRGVLLLDAQGRLVYQNDAAQRLDALLAAHGGLARMVAGLLPMSTQPALQVTPTALTGAFRLDTLRVRYTCLLVGAGAGARYLVYLECPELVADDAPAAAQPALTQRQYEIARLVARGLQNEEIAAHLGVSINTVKSHLKALMAKIGARNRAEVASALLGGRPAAPEEPHT